MPRIARKSYNCSFFHVIVQGYEKKCIFNDNFLKNKYLNLLLSEMKNFKVEVLEYCIMDNHAHVLLFCENVEQMSLYMKSVNTQYAICYNNQKERVGYVFRDRYLSEPIITQKHLYSCIAYIHMNPVVAKMVARPEHYNYSSYNDFLYKKGVATKSALLKLFGICDNYMELFEFIHFETGIGIEYKGDTLRKMSLEKAQKYIDYILRECCIDTLNDEGLLIQRFFFKLFLRKGIGIYQMEKIFGIEHRTIKKRILM